MDSTLGPEIRDPSDTVGNISSESTLAPARTIGLDNLSPLHIFTGVVAYLSGTVGCAANTVVLVVLMYARRQSGSSVNTYIINQTVLDLFHTVLDVLDLFQTVLDLFHTVLNLFHTVLDLLTCFLTIVTAVMFSLPLMDYDVNGIGQFGDNVICILFQGGALASFCVNAGKTSLVVITVERYFMIVHAVLHRKYYRSWMTSVGVILPAG